ncbi:MAG: hypothetical protein ACJ74W_08625 [Pyrinomonadaceae bacterium]
MNPNREEHEIRQLFRELKRADEGLAPPFMTDWGAALAQTNKAPRAQLMLRLSVTAVVALALLGSFAFIAFNRLLMQPIPPTAFAPTAIDAPSPPPSAVSNTASASHAESSQARLRRKAKLAMATGFGNKQKASRRRLPGQSQPPDMLISRWHSPTDFLLRSPGDRLLRTIPRLSTTTADIKALSFDENE